MSSFLGRILEATVTHITAGVVATGTERGIKYAQDKYAEHKKKAKKQKVETVSDIEDADELEPEVVKSSERSRKV